MTVSPFPAHEYGDDVHLIEHENQTILLVGTAHISPESVELVKIVIEQEQPDCVCLELDDKRYQALTQKKKWQSLDLKEIIRNKQLSTLLVSLLMASYQKRLCVIALGLLNPRLNLQLIGRCFIGRDS